MGLRDLKGVRHRDPVVVLGPHRGRRMDHAPDHLLSHWVSPSSLTFHWRPQRQPWRGADVVRRFVVSSGLS